LRVICAGRRLLAPSGYLWRAESEPSLEHLQPRSFLRLAEIRGFLDGEANDFLGGKMKVREDLWSPIKEKCLWKGKSTYKIAYDDAADVPAEAPRYHPFDLRLYAGWALDDPHLTPAAIQKANSAHYIELRIIGRLRDPALERALPLI